MWISITVKIREQFVYCIHLFPALALLLKQNHALLIERDFMELDFLLFIFKAKTHVLVQFEGPLALNL